MATVCDGAASCAPSVAVSLCVSPFQIRGRVLFACVSSTDGRRAPTQQTFFFFPERLAVSDAFALAALWCARAVWGDWSAALDSRGARRGLLAWHAPWAPQRRKEKHNDGRNGMTE